MENITYTLVFSTGPTNNGNLTGKWSCIQDRGNNTFVAWVFYDADPRKTGLFNNTPTEYNVNISQAGDQRTYLAFSKSSCADVQRAEQDIKDDRFEDRNFPAFGYDDVKRYTIKFIVDYTNVHFNNNMTWGSGSFRLSLRNNKTQTSLVNVTAEIV